MSLKEIIKAFADKHNLIYGCGSAAPFEQYRDILSVPVPFVGYSAEERIDPAKTLDGAKSLIALGLSYNNSYPEPKEGKLCARLSEGAVGRDYHLIMDGYLKELCALLSENSTEKYLPFCDTGPLSDGLVALRCNLGYNGFNHSVINDRLGTMFFIGYIITTAEIAPTPPVENKCTKCGLCAKSCPSGALGADGSFNAERCTAYLTQKKGIIPDELKPFMGSYIYGCDVCRRVCPLNPPQTAAQGCAYPIIADILNMTNRQFNEVYSESAIGWRGRRTIVRNAIIALGNIGDKRGLELIKPFLTDTNEDLKDAAKWAENRIRNKKYNG